MMEMKAVKDCTFMSFVDCISKKCCTLCERKDSSVYLFRSIPVTAIANNKWEDFTVDTTSFTMFSVAVAVHAMNGV